MERIEEACTQDQYEAGRTIIRAYARFLGLDLEFQGFSDELAALPKMYGPPRGCLLLAKEGNDYVGAVGLREFERGVAEMKRMFVFQPHQGNGLGKALTQAFLNKAKELGYRSVRLDSVRGLDRALGLYKQFGFKEIAPYRYNPYPDAIYMEYVIS